MNSSRSDREHVDRRSPADGAEDFDRYRAELLVVCYQMLGSPHDAEDVVQETMLRAWQARDRYDPRRASVRTWLHRIAFNTSLNALASRARRPLPSTLGEPSDDTLAPLSPAIDVSWLLPIASSRFAADASDPALRAIRTGALRLAFCAALQHLTPRQRAALILCEVLGFSASEAAVMLDTTVTAVNGLLQRARRALATRDIDVDPAPNANDRAVVERYVDAFLRADVALLTSMLTADAVLEMPPVPLWYRGADRYGAFMERVFALRGTEWRAVPVGANGQRGFAAYAFADGEYRLHTVQLLTTRGDRVSRNVVYQHPDAFRELGLAPTTAR